MPPRNHRSRTRRSAPFGFGGGELQHAAELRRPFRLVGAQGLEAEFVRVASRGVGQPVDKACHPETIEAGRDGAPHSDLAAASCNTPRSFAVLSGWSGRRAWRRNSYGSRPAAWGSPSIKHATPKPSKQDETERPIRI